MGHGRAAEVAWAWRNGVVPRGRPSAMVGVAALALLAACGDEGGGLRLPISAESGEARPAAGASADQEAPEVFQVAEDGLWDGRPSLGGIWVAHPDVNDPERVIIRNESNGQFVVGALFRRERENPGPSLQVSSDAAEALGMLAGDPTPLNVTALRRPEVDEAATGAAVLAADGTAAGLDGATETDVPGEETTGAPDEAVETGDEAALSGEALSAATAAALAGAPPEVADAGAEADAGADEMASAVSDAGANASAIAGAQPRADMTIPPEADPAILEAARAILAEAALPEDGFAAAAVEAAPVSAIAATPLPVGSAQIAGAPDPAPVPTPSFAPAVASASAAPVAGDPTPTERPFLQLGLFGVEANAQELVDRMTGLGLPARLVPVVDGDRPLWRVLVGPAATVGQRDAYYAQVQVSGFPDAYPVTD